MLQHFANGKVYEVCEIVHQLQESNVNEDLHGECMKILTKIKRQIIKQFEMQT